MSRSTLHYRDREIALWENLEKIRDALSMNDSEFADEMGLRASQFTKLRSRKLSPPATSVIDLAERINVSSDLFLSDKIDLKAAIGAYRGEPDVVPDRYSHTSFSKRRAVMPLFLGSEEFITPSATKYIYRRLQVSPGFLSDLDRPINLQFLVDACEILAEQYGCNSEAFRHMGQMSAKGNLGGHLHRVLSRLQSPMELYECVFSDLIHLFDENWKYSLEKLTEDAVTVKVVPRECIVEGFKTKTPGSAFLCDMKSGVGSSFLEFKGLPYAHMTHIRCIHRDDPECLYEFDYTLARTISTKHQAALLNFPSA